jgi:glycerate-2-kinase
MTLTEILRDLDDSAVDAARLESRCPAPPKGRTIVLGAGKAAAAAARHRWATIFTALADALVTGPTRTNVNGFRVILKL